MKNINWSWYDQVKITCLNYKCFYITIYIYIYILTTMLRGAANTLTEIATQIHPRTWTRCESFTRKCEERAIKENNPMFIQTNTFRVKFCNQLKFNIKLQHLQTAGLIIKSYIVPDLKERKKKKHLRYLPWEPLVRKKCTWRCRSSL
jgi:hypothetical protein